MLAQDKFAAANAVLGRPPNKIGSPVGAVRTKQETGDVYCNRTAGVPLQAPLGWDRTTSESRSKAGITDGRLSDQNPNEVLGTRLSATCRPIANARFQPSVIWKRD